MSTLYNSGHTWNDRSKVQLLTLSVPLREVMDDARRLSDVPFQLVQGARTIEQQQEYYNAKKSKINPSDPKYLDRNNLYRDAKHIVGPGCALSRAVDIIFDGSKPYDVSHLTYIAGVIMTVGRTRGIKLRWGGNWDQDKEIITDQDFDDLPHFELM